MPEHAVDRVWPSVSVVMPVRNEASNIERAIQSVLDQSYEGSFDVWVAVAPSSDDTEAIVRRLETEDSRVHFVSNPRSVTPAGLNAAIQASRGDIIVRVDGHVHLFEGYISTAVESLRANGAANVGGRQVAEGRTPFEIAVAAVMMSIVGSGGATYRTGAIAGPTDTVFLGVFDRSAGDRVGWFDESLIRNQDYELNIRLRKAGGIVWFDPNLEVEYRPRSSYRLLWRQYFDYGRYKALVMRLHGSSVRLRQVLPPIGVAGFLSSVILGFLWWPLWLPMATYLALVTVLVRGGIGVRLRASLIALTMHSAWTLGLVRGLVKRR